MYILYTVINTFPKVLTRRICLKIKSSFRAYFHGSGGPQIDKVTYLDGVMMIPVHKILYFIFITFT